MNRDRLAERLLATFLLELEEQVQSASRHLLALESAPEDAEALKALFRVMHTLKGAARAAGIAELESLCHALETLLAEVRDGRRALGADEIATLFAGLDALDEARAALRRGERLAGWEMGPLIERLARGEIAPSAPEVVATRRRVSGAVEEVPRVSGAASEPVSSNGSAVVRVDVGRVDALVTAASRMLIATGQAEAHADALRDVQERLAANPDGRVVQQELARLAQEAETIGRRLRTIAGEVSAGVRELRMRPFAELAEPLPRLVRDLASATGKEVRIEIETNDVEADRAVLEEVREALLHLVRNAIDHGLERPEAREAAGKPRQGTVRVAAQVVADRLVVTVEDDGVGLDIDAIRAQLEREGAEVPEDDREVARALFHGGISTRRHASAISGRGVGLDAARAALERARGSMDVAWTRGRGTRFTLDAPLSLATVRAVIASIGAQLIAVPSAFVDRLVRVRPDSLRALEGRDVLSTSDAPVPVVSLARVLGPPLVERAAGETRQAMQLSVGGRRLVLTVDDVVGEQELVVRPITARGRSALPYVSGAALLPSGRIALVLNATAVVPAGLRLDGGLPAAPAPEPAVAARRRVLVVDDSITTRTLEQSVLEASGYDVLTAVDGSDAWRVLQERGADLVLSDVEMPRMDGFALCEAIRGSTRFRELPVVLVTALETAEDRARGLEVGADAYIGKSSFDQETLLETIRQLLG